MPYEDDYKMWLEKMLIEMNPDWVCDGMGDVELTHEWCHKHCGEGSDYVTPKCLHMFYHHIARSDHKDEPQTERISPCPMCGCIPSIRFEIGRGWEVLCKGHNETSLCPTRDWAIQSWNELVEEQTERGE